MNKEQLETNLAALKLLVSEHNEKTTDYKNQVADLEKQLEDYNKPELTSAQMSDIEDAVSSAVGNFDFDDSNNYQPEFELDYDGKINLSSMNFESYELVEMIVEKVCNLFKEVEELDTTEKDNHKPVE